MIVSMNMFGLFYLEVVLEEKIKKNKNNEPLNKVRKIREVI